jgi:hypothetical protein
MPDLIVRRLTHEGLRETIKTRLGAGTFRVELEERHLDDAILAALQLFGSRKPMIGYAGIDVVPEIKAYKIDHDIGYGIFNVEFVQPDPQPSALFYANLLDVAPIKPATMESYDIFLRWRKSFMRITSVKCSYQWDEINQTLMIDCPIERTRACYMWHQPREIRHIPMQFIPWFNDYCVAKAKLTLGQIRSKFQGQLPGPARDLTLNGDTLKQEAQEEILRLEAQLLNMQGDRPPLVA